MLQLQNQNQGFLRHRTAGGISIPDFSTNLWAYWRLNSSPWADSGPNVFGPLTQAGTVSAVAAQVGNGANFVGNAANYLTVNEEMPPPGGPWSLHCWVYPHTTNQQTLFGNNSAGISDGWRLVLRSGEPTFGFESSDSGSFSTESVVSSVVIAPENWYHIVVTVDEAQMGRLYVNGVVTQDEHIFFTASALAWFVGRDLDTSFPADSIIDEIAIWDGRVLSQSEVDYLGTGVPVI